MRIVYRTDRYSRGGDQVPMLAAGYPAVRFTEAIENYTREHEDVARRTACITETPSMQSILLTSRKSRA